MAIKLIIESLAHDLERDDLVCEQSLITFGRSKSCLVELNNSQVSKRHFIIRFTEGRYIVMDEGSASGTMLDGETLEPLKSYDLEEHHQISVPGFNISVFNDGHPPRMERTTVVARKLMGQILQDAGAADHYPRLEDKSGSYVFIFSNDKSSFVLGSSAHLDFVMTDAGIFKEHISFIRDIFGVRLIPIMDAQIKVQGTKLLEAHVMKHGEIVEIGHSTFIFKDHADESLASFSMPASETKDEIVDDNIKEEEEIPVKTSSANKRNSSFRTSDGIFLGLFMLVTLGASLMFVALI